MAFTVIIHLSGTDPFLAEMDELPDPEASFIVCTNPRARDGKNLIFIEPECTRFMFPWHRISFVETYPTDEDRAKVETFFRE
jgi:hypothetical protein